VASFILISLLMKRGRWSITVRLKYTRSGPQTTSLWKLLNCHFVDFEEGYAILFQKKRGFYRLVISHVVRKYHEYGDLREGFARKKSPDCHHEFLLAFSCRGRWFCPICHNKKVVQFGHHLKESVLYPFPHRQYVFSIPGIIVIIQTFDDYARWHPHLYVLVSDSLFLESGFFFVMSEVEIRTL